MTGGGQTLDQAQEAPGRLARRSADVLVRPRKERGTVPAQAMAKKVCLAAASPAWVILLTLGLALPVAAWAKFNSLDSQNPSQPALQSIVITPSSPTADQADRAVFLLNQTVVARETAEVPLRFKAFGNENALGFSVGFDTTLVRLLSVEAGAAAAGAALNINTNQLGAGRIGFALARPAGQYFAAGANELLRLRFDTLGATGICGLTFGDEPVLREMVDASASPLPLAVFQDGVLTITPLFPPVIVSQPQGRTVQPILNTPTNVILSVTATGSPPLFCQWRRESVPIADATHTSLTFSNVTPADSGGYDVVVSNSGGAATSQVAVVTVLPALVPPALKAQPQSWVASAGESVMFGVAATGTEPLSYQWRFNAAAIAGETNHALLLTNVSTARNGNYSCVVTNRAGSVTSANATLAVSAAPRMLRLLDASVATSGEVDVPVELAALGDENALGFSVAFDPALLSYVQAAAGSGAPTAALLANTNEAASGRIGVALVRSQGERFTAGASQAVLLRFRAGDTPGPAELSFASRPVELEVADVWGSSRPFVASNGVVHVLSTAPAIVSQPQSVTNRIFSTAMLSVTAAGSQPLGYQWQFQGANLPGATQATLLLPGVRPGQAGGYRVIVTNPVAAVTSSVATLTVPRGVRVASTNAPTGNLVDVPLHLLANGDENALGFSLRFDPARLSFREVVSNSWPAGATLNLNANAAASGTVGFVVAQPYGGHFALGTQQVAVARFQAGNTAGATELSFTDQPVLRELVDSAATSLLAEFQSGAVTAQLAPPVVALQPVAQTVLQGTAVSFSVAAAGSLPLSYQWQRNGVNLPGQTTASLALPNVLLAEAGAYSCRITNLAGATNTAAAILTVLPPPADLFVTQLAAPAEVTAGESVTLWWTITNAGTQTAQGPWQDAVFIADNPQGRDARPLGSFTFLTPLAASAWLNHTGVVIVPPDLAGPRFFRVLTDSAYQVPESNETNNAFVPAAATVIRVADLSASLPAASSTGLFSGSISVTWAVTNAGDASASGAWSDRLYLSASSHSLAGATVLAAAAGVRPLPPGAGYERTVSATLPDGASLAPGTWFLVAVADFDNAQTELAEDNNTAFAPITLSHPPRPDLAIAQVLAPPAASAGQPFPLVWAVTNRGGIAVSGLWSDTLWVSNATSGLQELARFDFTNGLAAGASLWRTQAVALPITGPAGAVWLGVETDGLGEIAEENEMNNFALATNATLAPLRLTLQLPLTQISEDAANLLFVGTVVRNGDPAGPLTVALTSSDTNEMIVPAAVTLPAGQTSAGFTARVAQDHQVDGPKTVTIGASAAGYAAASQTLTVLDADRPRLTLTLATNAVWEGDSVIAAVARDLVTTNPVTVALQSSHPGQLSPPSFVLIPAGEAGAAFPVLAVDDILVEGVLEYSVSASASGFEAAAATVVLLDDDLPHVAITLASAIISEGDGPQATLATVTRSIASSRSLAVDLESTNTAAAQAPARVVIPASQLSATFPVAAVDNDRVDGPKTTFLRPFPLASGSDVRVDEGSGASLTVTDDDGPTLRLVVARNLVGEGLNLATTLTVSRNTPATNALAVALASSNPGEAAVPASATIPAGSNAVAVPVASVADGVTDGNQSVMFTASAPGFVSGRETIVVSDTDLSDLVVSSITAPATAETDGFVTVGYRVLNQGIGPAGTNFLVRVYLSEDSFGQNRALVAQSPFEGAIPAGLFFEQTLQVRLPLAAGDYWVVVEVDAAEQIAEILEGNNTRISPAPIASHPAYGAWVQTSLTTALANTPVPLSGRATNALGAGVPAKLVNLHILTRGTERVISALTDSLGNFATTWQPLPGEAGFYQIFAAHPGVSNVPVQAEFRLVGMRAEPASAALKVVEGATHAGSVQIENLSDLPLTGVNAAVVSAPSGLAVTVQLAGGGILAGGAKTPLNYKVSPATPQAYGNVIFRVASAEGATADVTLAVSVEPLRPRLAATPGSLAAGMVRGRQAVVEFSLVNEGGVATGPITVALPAAPWLSLATTNPIPPLLPGETNGTTVPLLLTPAAGLPLGNYEGSLALNSSNASLSVPFAFRALFEAKGDLLITAVDELTYYAEGSPRLAGASVTVRDAVTLTNVAAGFTDANGQFFVANLMESYYEIEVTAEKHTTYRNPHLILAGQTNEVRTFLSRQVVTYSWTVEPIEVEDRYQITIETTFETVVPLPVVTVEPSVIDLAEMTADVTQIDLKITNHGLIAAKNTRVNFPTHPLWHFQPLIELIGALPAKSTLTVPLTIRKLAGSPPHLPAVRAANAGSGECHLWARACYEIPCGPDLITICIPIAMPNAQANCGGPFTPPGGGLLGGAGSSGGGVYVAGPSVVTPVECDLCLAKAYAECLIGMVPGLGDAYGYAQCLRSAMADGLLHINTAETCLSMFLPGPAGCAYGFLRCECDGPLESVPGCAWDLAQGVFGSFTASSFLKNTPVQRGGGLAVPQLYYYAALSYPEIELYELVLDAPADLWLAPGASASVQRWINAFRSKTQAASESGISVSETELADLLSMPVPQGIGQEQVVHIAERWNRTWMNWRAGVFEAADLPAGADTNFISLSALLAVVDRILIGHEAAQAAGFATPAEGLQAMIEESASLPRESGVCARIKLRTEQEAVLTRDAFRATLEIENTDAARLEQVAVTLWMRDEAGADVTDLFGVRAPELTGLSEVDGAGILAAQSTGTARWIIIPTVDAAPAVERRFFVSGQLNYVQGGTSVSVPLAPVSITVLPSPRLALNYFHQRDVFSDDPFTDAVEPSVPFNLAVMVQNRGCGMAKNFRITSAQPQIVENEKGLLIDFQILATEVAGRNLVPSLTANFGNIGPGTTAIGRWLMTATLQGLFIGYNATFEHIDGLGNLKLSLIDEVAIHEMNHLVQAGGAFEDGKPDFLVNDLPDLYDRPDTLYLSDGRTAPVAVVETAQDDGPPTPARLEIQLSAPMPSGWGYLRVPEPSDGRYRLVGVRSSNGRTIAVETNAWVTDRTFIGMGRRPIWENTLHLLDYDSPGLYTLTYELGAAGDTTAPASQVAALPAESYQRIPVSWSGQDQTGGSGLAGYDILVSKDGGTFTHWLQRTRLTGSVYFGALGSRYAFYSVAIDEAGNREAAPGTPDALTTVTLTNRPPMLAAAPDQTMDEGLEFVLALDASDPDPADALSYSLLTAPPGMTIHPANGLMRWPTSEATGPSTNPIVARVQDNGDPPLAATVSFTLLIREVNLTPALAAIADCTVSEGELIVITNAATDSDLPRNRLTFSLQAGHPAGATVNPANGVFTWQPTETQGPSTNRIGLIVADNGTPSLSATQYFTAIVRDTLSDFTLSLGQTNLLAGEPGVVPVELRSSLDLTNLTLLLDAPVSRLTNLTLRAFSGEVVGAGLLSSGDNQWRINLALDPKLASASVRTIALLHFLAVSNLHSAIVTLEMHTLLARRSDGALVTNGKAGNGQVIVVGREPVLVAKGIPTPSITLYGHPGKRYAFQAKTNLLETTPWTDAGYLTLLGRFAAWPIPDLSSPLMVYRACELGEAGPLLSIESVSGSIVSFRLQGRPGAPYNIQTSTNLSPTAVWNTVRGLGLTNAWQIFDWTNQGEAQRLFRALEP